MKCSTFASTYRRQMYATKGLYSRNQWKGDGSAWLWLCGFMFTTPRKQTPVTWWHAAGMSIYGLVNNKHVSAIKHSWVRVIAGVIVGLSILAAMLVKCACRWENGKHDVSGSSDWLTTALLIMLVSVLLTEMSLALAIALLHLPL